MAKLLHLVSKGRLFPYLQSDFTKEHYCITFHFAVWRPLLCTFICSLNAYSRADGLCSWNEVPVSE